MIRLILQKYRELRLDILEARCERIQQYVFEARLRRLYQKSANTLEKEFAELVRKNLRSKNPPT